MAAITHPSSSPQPIPRTLFGTPLEGVTDRWAYQSVVDTHLITKVALVALRVIMVLPGVIFGGVYLFAAAKVALTGLPLAIKIARIGVCLLCATVSGVGMTIVMSTLIPLRTARKPYMEEQQVIQACGGSQAFQALEKVPKLRDIQRSLHGEVPFVANELTPQEVQYAPLARSGEEYRTPFLALCTEDEKGDNRSVTLLYQEEKFFDGKVWFCIEGPGNSSEHHLLVRHSSNQCEVPLPRVLEVIERLRRGEVVNHRRLVPAPDAPA